MKTFRLLLLSVLYVSVRSTLQNHLLQVHQGETITLSCSNYSEDASQVDWFKLQIGSKPCFIASVFGSDGEPSVCCRSTDGRFHMSSNKTDVFLRIQEVKLSDSGRYLCKFHKSRSRNITLEETIWLNVFNSSIPTMEEKSQNGDVTVRTTLQNNVMEVHQGETITLSCSNYSKDESQMNWFKLENGTKPRCIVSIFGSDGKPLFCDGFKDGRFEMSSNITDVFLRIQEVKLSDSGVYSCRFYIKLDSVLENKMYLNVTSEDRPVGNNTETETKCPTDHVVPVVLGGVTALCIVITVGLSLKILRLQKAAKDQTVDTAEGSLVAARVFMATSLRSRRPNTPEHTHVVYTVIK